MRGGQIKLYTGEFTLSMTHPTVWGSKTPVKQTSIWSKQKPKHKRKLTHEGFAERNCSWQAITRSSAVLHQSKTWPVTEQEHYEPLVSQNKLCRLVLGSVKNVPPQFPRARISLSQYFSHFQSDLRYIWSQWIGFGLKNSLLLIWRLNIIIIYLAPHIKPPVN